MSKHSPAARAIEVPKNARVAVVASEFNAHIVDKLIDGCLARLKKYGLDDSRIELHRVPGAFELPTAAKLLAQTRKFSAIVCLGCVIRGDTPHFDYVAGEAARGIQQVAIGEALPVIFGVLTTNTEEQAQARAGGSHSHAGENAADTALRMIELAHRIGSKP
jgi:6,7-dimethyl-8-ribityllumazine synthase